MDRRSFLRLKPAEGTNYSHQAFTDIQSGLEPYQGPWKVPQVSHLLRRVLFGAKWEEVQFFLSMSPSEAVDSLLSVPTELPPAPVNDYATGTIEDPDVPLGESWLSAPFSPFSEGSRIWSLKSWWLANIIEQDRSILEKMTVFWHNHMPVGFYEVFVARWNHRYIMTLRQNALGNFRTLMREVTLDPAMLVYLNGFVNDKGAPDENFARELQELFCIGKGPNAAFTEEDVRMAARVLTGWRINRDTDEVYFNQYAHDTTDKQFSEFYQNTMISGKEGADGALELDELLDMILSNPECALFLCRKIYRFFVHHDIDPLTEELVIEPLAELLRSQNYEILPVMQTLFKSQHFFDQMSKGALIKSPIDFLAGLYREFDTPIPPRDLYLERYRHNGTVMNQIQDFDQDLGDPPNVSGWPAYYQIPNFDKSWITTNTLPKRAEFTDWILWYGVYGLDFVSQLDILGVVSQIPNAEDPNLLIDQILEWKYSIEVPPAFKEQLKSILLSGQVNDYYWTDAWLEYKNNPDDEMLRNIVSNRLNNFFYTILHQAEYQLC